MTTPATIQNLSTSAGMRLASGARPTINKKTGQVMIKTARDVWVNSLLRKDEWESLDQVVVDAATQRLVGIMQLRNMGLVKTEGSIGVLVSQWNTVSEMTAASINMSGRSAVSEDRVDYNLTGAPLPVIAKMYEIGQRELEASRAFGSSLDTTHAFAAGRVAGEALENMLFNGNATINFNGDQIFGYTTEPNRNTGVATGVWSTITNILPTVAAMIAASNAANYFGPYWLYAATTQFNEAANTYFNDGSSDTAFDRIVNLSSVNGFSPSDFLADGVILLVQLTRDVVDVAQVPGFELVNLEWASGDGMANMFKVVTVAVPRVKSDFSGNSGVTHFTGA